MFGHRVERYPSRQVDPEADVCGRLAAMRINRFNRVELLVEAHELDDAVARFNELPGFNLELHEVEGADVRSAVDWGQSVEIFAASGPDSILNERRAIKGRGAVGPLVWEVDDIEEAKAWAAEKGIKVIYEYKRQICLDPEHFYGYTVTLTEPTT
jgi:hypothetical protein